MARLAALAQVDSGFDVDAFEEETEPLEVDFGDGKVLHLHHRPNAIKLKDKVAQPDATPEEAAALLVRVIASWDMVRRGQPVPITTEALVELPATLLFRIGEALFTAATVPPTNA